MKPIVITERFDPMGLRIEDNGKAVYFDVQNGEHPELFVRLHSWDETKAHNELISIIDHSVHENKKIKVTIELIDWD